MKKIQDAIKESIAVKQKIVDNAPLLITIERAANLLYEALKDGHKVFFCGNGGSAADAQHLAAELSGRFYFDRDPLPAEALHCNTSYITAVANDYGYDVIYSRMLKGSASAGDVVVGLSTSGNSVNIIKAFEVAETKGMKSIALTGLTGGTMKGIADLVINVPSTDTARIQESHITIGHIMCEIVEARLFGNK